MKIKGVIRYNEFKLSILFLFLLFIIPLISAAPPVTTVSQFVEGYNIKAPQITVLKQNQGFEFEFHIYNISNGVPITSGIGCYFHYYNETGQHQAELYDETVGHTFDYSFKLNEGNFSETGYRNYLIQCNSSKLGGELPQQILITPNGEEISEGKAILDLSFLILLLFLFGFMILIFMKSENIALRVGMFGGIYFLLVIISFTAWNIADNYVTAARFLAEVFRWQFIILMILALPLLIFSFVYYLFAFRKIKELRRLYKKGFSWEDAERRVSRKDG